jgi:hypothetical protein
VSENSENRWKFWTDSENYSKFWTDSEQILNIAQNSEQILKILKIAENSEQILSNENEIKYIDLRRKIEIKKMSNLMRNEII